MVLSNKSFAQKKKILEKHKGTYDVADILEAADWGVHEIEARTARLAKMAQTEVWPVSGG